MHIYPTALYDNKHIESIYAYAYWHFYQHIDQDRNNWTPSCLKPLHYLICCILKSSQLRCHFVLLLVTPAPHDSHQGRRLFSVYWLLAISVGLIHQGRTTFKLKLNKFMTSLLLLLNNQFIFNNGRWCQIIRSWLPLSGYVSFYAKSAMCIVAIINPVISNISKTIRHPGSSRS